MEEYLAHKKSSSRRTVESKLVQDEVRLKELQRGLAKSEELTGGMVSSAEKIEGGRKGGKGQ